MAPRAAVRATAAGAATRTTASPAIDSAAREDDGLELRAWLRLLGCSSLIGGGVRRRLRTRFATTLPRFDILAQLDRAPGGLTMGALSRNLMVSNGNVTSLIDRLVTEGLVERHAHPGDRRVQTVRLTAPGKAEFDRMTPEHRRWIAGMFAGLDRDELATLYGLLGRLGESVAAGETRELEEGERR